MNSVFQRVKQAASAIQTARSITRQSSDLQSFLYRNQP